MSGKLTISGIATPNGTDLVVDSKIKSASSDPPNDSKQYVRVYDQWEELKTGGGGGDLSAFPGVEGDIPYRNSTEWVALKPESVPSRRASCNYCQNTSFGTTTYNGVTLEAFSNGVLSVDGFNPVVGQRILVNNQPNSAANGVYTVTNTGSIAQKWLLTKRTEALYEPVWVFTGTKFANTQWERQPYESIYRCYLMSGLLYIPRQTYLFYRKTYSGPVLSTYTNGPHIGTYAGIYDEIILDPNGFTLNDNDGVFTPDTFVNNILINRACVLEVSLSVGRHEVDPSLAVIKISPTGAAQTLLYFESPAVGSLDGPFSGVCVASVGAGDVIYVGNLIGVSTPSAILKDLRLYMKLM